MSTVQQNPNDLYNTINDYSTNPIILGVMVLIIIFYYIIFSFIGLSDNKNISGIFSLFEALLWGLFLILVFTNAVLYFFDINIVTEFNNIINKKLESEPVIKPVKQIDPNEVYHVPGNRFTYHDAKAVCKAFDGEMATYEQLEKSYKKGASWCSYGWTKDQLGLYPTSQNNWKKLQKKKGHEYDCGLPGINGGYVSNPHVELGANCYGIKPSKSKLESDNLDNKSYYPKTHKELLFEQRVKYWKDRIGNILISPFNTEKWSKI